MVVISWVYKSNHPPFLLWEGPRDGCSRAARDFFGMLRVWESVVPSPTGMFVHDQQRRLPASASRKEEMLCSFVGKNKEKNWLKFSNTTNYSTNLAPFSKTGYEAGTGIVRLICKASKTGFSRHIKTGCNLPVCITIY